MITAPRIALGLFVIAALSSACAPAAPPAPPGPVALAQGEPAVPASACIPMDAAPVLEEEQQTIAVCRHERCAFTTREEKLLKLAEASSRADLIENARTLREKRIADTTAACARLRAAGKL